MPVGGRTTKRMTSAVFQTTPVKKKSGGATVGAKYCEGSCEIFCHERAILLQQLIKDKPDPTRIAEDITDFRTISDMVLGGMCACKCENINTIIGRLEREEYKSLGK